MEKTSYSALTKHRRCPQQWNYSQVLKYERKDGEGPATALELGAWWHALMAADSIQRGQMHSTLAHAPTTIRTTRGGPCWRSSTVTPRAVLDDAETYWGTLTEEYREEWDKALGGDDLAARLGNMHERWRQRWAAERNHEQPVAVELRWTRELTGTLTLVGVADEIYWDDARGLMVIRDHKTSRSLSESTMDDMMDSQLQVYAWGLEDWMAAEHPDANVALAYDRVRTSRPKTPKLTLAGTLSKSVTDYDAWTYRQWAAAGVHFSGRAKSGAGAGTYNLDEKHLTALEDREREEVWFKRTLTPVNRNLLEAHLDAARSSSESMSLTRQWIEGHAGAAPRNLSRNCRWCDFHQLCRAQMVGGDEGDYVLADYGLQRRQW